MNWISSNVGGQTKRAAAITLMSVGFSIGNIIGPQSFQAKDAPDYIPAKVTVLATLVCGAGVAIGMRFYYHFQNVRKEVKEGRAGLRDPESAAKDNIRFQWMDRMTTPFLH